MIENVYYWIRKLTSRPGEKGSYSSGYWQNKVRKKALDPCFGIKGRLLEVGCGEGFFLAQLARKNPDLEIYGIDTDSGRIKEAQDLAAKEGLKNIKLVVQDGASLSFPEGYFDAVVCINVILSLGSREMIKKVLREMARVCKKDGKLIIDFRNSENPFIPIKYKFAPFYDPTVKHLPLKGYKLKEMRLILEEAGLVITDILYLGFSVKRFAPIIMLEAEKR